MKHFKSPAAQGATHTEMSLQPAIAIFVKTPGHSKLKTRLLASLPSHWHDPEAWVQQFYLHAALSVAEVAASVGVCVYWAMGEAAGKNYPAWQGLPHLLQANGPAAGLGERMHHVMAQLLQRHSGGILLGADTPQLNRDELLSIVAHLQHREPRQAIGNAEDGGFWCYGSNRPAPLALWESVPYSQMHTAAEFCQQFASLAPIKTYSTKIDVDHYHDLAPCLHALTQLTAPSPRQQALREFLARDLNHAPAN
jgi:uncharacterized protein